MNFWVTTPACHQPRKSLITTKLLFLFSTHPILIPAHLYNYNVSKVLVRIIAKCLKGNKEKNKNVTKLLMLFTFSSFFKKFFLKFVLFTGSVDHVNPFYFPIIIFFLTKEIKTSTTFLF